MIDSAISKTPLVSIVIPVFNVSRYLSQCLESVINQTYQNIEIIMIDDGSTDGSGRICDEFARHDPRIQVLHTKNHGLSSARNLALENVRASYLSFIDSDDWMEPHTIETFMKTALQTGADIVKANFSREYMGQTIHNKKMEEKERLFRSQEILPAFAAGLFNDVVWNKLYDMKCFTGSRFPDEHNYEDVFTTWKLMRVLAENNGSVAVLPEELIHFRMRKSSISHTKSLRNIVDCWAAYHEKYEGMPDFQGELLSSCYTVIGRMWANYNAFSKKEKKEAADTMLEMQTFSKMHFGQVMRGKYPPKTKCICFTALFKAPFVMWICHCIGKLYKAYANQKHMMFD